MADLQSKRWIVAKGLMFMAMVGLAAGLLLLEHPTARTAALLLILIWAAARAYYFLFYVLERYVDPRLRYAGLLALVQAIWRTRHK